MDLLPVRRHRRRKQMLRGHDDHLDGKPHIAKSPDGLSEFARTMMSVYLRDKVNSAVFHGRENTFETGNHFGPFVAGDILWSWCFAFGSTNSIVD